MGIIIRPAVQRARDAVSGPRRSLRISWRNTVMPTSENPAPLALGRHAATQPIVLLTSDTVYQVQPGPTEITREGLGLADADARTIDP